MSNPRAPAHQLFYGPMYGDPLAQQIPHLGGQNPATVAAMHRRYGRYLSGFGQDPVIPPRVARVAMSTAWMLPAAIAAAWVGKSKGSFAWGLGAGAATALVTSLVGDAIFG